MKKTIKTLLSALIAVAMIVSMSVMSFAKNIATVYSETFTATAGENIDVPVYIKDNPGLMGYKFTISYNKSVFTPVKVTQGTAIKSGNFNDSIDTSKNNEFVVLWSNTANASDNGLLFTVNFKTDSAAKGEYTITIKYSRDDTFNENWQEVKFNCENAVVDFGGVEVEPEPVPAPTVWERIINIFKIIINFIVNLFK